MGISMEAQKEAILEKSKKTMSVPEMRRLLGLKKTDSYWLVHRNFFQTYIVNGQMRVDIASFEKWYANQVKHKKVNPTLFVTLPTFLESILQICMKSGGIRT